MIVVTGRPCQQCRTSNMIRVGDTLTCWFCDGVDSWPMCQPAEQLIEEMPRWRKAFVFWALVVVTWVPVIAVVRWWWHS